VATAGKIMLVGIGPGSEAHMTARARQAIQEADTVIGYVTYIKLVADLLEGKEIIRKSMTEELDRAVSALEAARQGKKVALISSGDAGVYGMVQVEIIPGASALNSCAALVGAPLTHDFCAISLSDLLTPWPTIARRLDAVAMADFVVALYNPKSGRRTRQIVEAQRLFLRHRRSDTPVAIVKSAYRRREHIVFTTLDQMAEADIGMLTTVLIGNSNTFVRHGLMVTPRGYANKYDLEQGGETRDGEKRGRSLSTGLLGWLDTLQAEHAEGLDIDTLAARHRLPADYIRSTLVDPVTETAVEPEENA
jgi:precorrin-3B C17-methyltransferase